MIIIKKTDESRFFYVATKKLLPSFMSDLAHDEKISMELLINMTEFFELNTKETKRGEFLAESFNPISNLLEARYSLKVTSDENGEEDSEEG